MRETNRMLTAQGEEKGIQIRERGRELTALREQVPGGVRTRAQAQG